MRLLKISLATISLALVLTGCGMNGNNANPSGTLEVTEIDLAPSLSGRVLEARPRLGDTVSAGDTMLIIDTDLIRLKRAQTATGLESVRARMKVAQDRLEQAKLNFDLAETTLERISALTSDGSATRQQLDEATTRRDIARLKISEVKHNITALEAERNKLDAALAVFDRQLADGVLLAPSDGIVLVRTAEPGEMVNPNTTAYRIADISSLELRVYLDEPDLDRVRIGEKVRVSIDAVSDSTLTGTVTWISSEAEFTPKNAQTRKARTQLVYAVKLRIGNPKGILHIGMPAEVIL